MIRDRASLDIRDSLQEINPAGVQLPDLEASNRGRIRIKNEDLFADVSKKAWRHDSADAARCDMAPNRHTLNILSAKFAVFSLYKRTTVGRTLLEIKEDDDMVPTIAKAMAEFIQKLIGYHLQTGDFCIICPPMRRHKERNFACRIADEIGNLLNIPYHHDISFCDSKQRVNAVFHLRGGAPPQSNIIVFDDIKTSGSTLTSMFNLLEPLKKNLFFFAAINNRV